MKKKTVIATLITLGLLLYTLWLVADRFYFAIAVLGLVSVVVHVVLLGGGFLLFAAIVERLLPRQLRARCRAHRVRYRVAMVIAIVLFVYVGWTINRLWLPHRFHPLSLGADVVVLLYAVLVAWTIFISDRRRLLMLGWGSAVFVFFVAGLAIVHGLTSEDSTATTIEKLRALPYLTWVPAENGSEKAGVVAYDSTRAFAGVNLYNPRNLSTAYLMDMNGNVVHEWSAGIEADDGWHHIEMTPEGDLLVIVKDQEIMRLDWSSTIKWIRKLRPHHDIAIAPNDDIYVLSRKDTVVSYRGLPLPILDDRIVVLSPDNVVKREISMWRVLSDRIPRSRQLKTYRQLLDPRHLRSLMKSREAHHFAFETGSVYDAFHSNSIEVIDHDVSDIAKRGRVLYCSRTLDMIGIIDVERRELLWSWGPGVLEGPHHPTLLDNGHILLYDNGIRRRYTRVIEIDPATGTIVWKFTTDPKSLFFSRFRGANQRLPNGNTLITDSDSGHVFEVTREGEIVWEFYDPVMLDKKVNGVEMRAAIYRMMRLYDRNRYPVLERLEK